MPLAPPRLSITNCWPSASPIFCATARATMSALPPGVCARHLAIALARSLEVRKLATIRGLDLDTGGTLAREAARELGIGRELDLGHQRAQLRIVEAVRLERVQPHAAMDQRVRRHVR